MKALVTDSYGDATVLRIDDVPNPVPDPDDVLIKVRYSTVNRTDTGILSGMPRFARLVFGLQRPKVRIRGCEFSGIVMAAGTQSGEFNVGDEVLGFYDEGARCHAEQCAINKKYVSRIPAGVTLEDAAAAGEGPFYAHNYIRSLKRDLSGARVFVNGISGGIGNVFGQLAQIAGAEVSGTCAQHAFSKLKAVGLDGLIDYQQRDVADVLQKKSFDVFLDTVGNFQYSQAKPYLAKGATYGSSELGKRGHNVVAALMPWTPVIFPIPRHYQECRENALTHLSNGDLRPVIDQIFAFDEIIDAYRYVEKGHKTGNVLIRFDQ